MGGNLGGTMRLGAYPAHLRANSRIAKIYGGQDISERHRHRYEVNDAYRERLEAKGVIFAGSSPDGLLPETIEILDHPWFIGVQYHPELKSRPFDPHPLFASFIEAAKARADWYERGGGAGVLSPARLFALDDRGVARRRSGLIFAICIARELKRRQAAQKPSVDLGFA